MKTTKFISKFIAIVATTIIAITGTIQLPTFAALNESETIDISLKNLSISSKDNQKILGKVELVNNTNTSIPDLFFASEVYLNSDDGSNLINKVFYPVKLSGKQTLSIEFNNIFTSTLYKGNYFMIARLYNRAGLPLGLEYLDLGNMGVEKGYLVFNTEKCFIINKGEELDPQSGPSYTKGQGVPFKLDVKNPTNGTVNGELWARVYERNETFNPNAAQNMKVGNYSFNANENKTINITLNGTSVPESYLVIISFLDNQKSELSGKFSARYVVEGPSSKIIGTEVVDEGNGTTNFNVSIAGPADGSILPNTTINVTLKDKTSGNVIATKETTADLGAGILTVKIPLQSNGNDFSNYIVETNVIYDGQKLDSNSIVGNTLNNATIINISGNSNLNNYNSGANTTTTTTASATNPTTSTPTNTNPSKITDVANTPFKDAVESLIKEGIVKGYEDGTFRGYNDITRAEFATMMCYMLKRNAENGNYQNLKRFPDVTSSHWGAGFVNIANESGLMAGYPDGSFKPDQNITYAEVITVIVKIANNGKDIQSNLEWPFNYLVEGKEMKLTNDITFSPREKAIRGNVAKLVYNAINIKKGSN